MADHPCTVREARCLQQDGVLPSVTLALVPEQASNTDNPVTPARSFFDQDFQGLKYVYRATLKVGALYVFSISTSQDMLHHSHKGAQSTPSPAITVAVTSLARIEAIVAIAIYILSLGYLSHVFLLI